jgi:hypothetical protein
VHKEFEKRRKVLDQEHNLDIAKAKIALNRKRHQTARGRDKERLDAELVHLELEAGIYEESLEKRRRRFGERVEIGALSARRTIAPEVSPVRQITKAFRRADLSALKGVYSINAVPEFRGSGKSDAEILTELARRAGATSNDTRHMVQWMVGSKIASNMAGSAHVGSDRVAPHTALTCLSGGSGASADRSDSERGYFSARAFSETSFRARHLLNGYSDQRRMFTLACTWLHDSLGLVLDKKLELPGFDADAVRAITRDPEHVAVAFLSHAATQLVACGGVNGSHLLPLPGIELGPRDRVALVEAYLLQAIRNSLVGAAVLRPDIKFPARPRLLDQECDRLALLDAIGMGHGFLLTPELNGRGITRLGGAEYRATGAKCSTVDTRWWSTSSVILIPVDNADWTLPNPRKRVYSRCRASSRIYPSALALKIGLESATRAADKDMAIVAPVTHWEFHVPSKTFVAHVAEFGDPAGAVTYSLATMLGDTPETPCRQPDGSFLIRTPCPPRFSPISLYLQVVGALTRTGLLRAFRGCSLLQLLFRLEGGAKNAFVEFGRPYEINGLGFGPRDTLNVVASIIATTKNDSRVPLTPVQLNDAAPPMFRIPAWAFGGVDATEHDATNALLEMAIEAFALEAALAAHAAENCVPALMFPGRYKALYGDDHKLEGGYNRDDLVNSGELEGHMKACVEAATVAKKELESLRPHRCFIGTFDTHAHLSDRMVEERQRRLIVMVSTIATHMPRHDVYPAPAPNPRASPVDLCSKERKQWEGEDLFLSSVGKYPKIEDAVPRDHAAVVISSYDERGLLGLRPLGWYDVVRNMTNAAHDTA